MSTFFIVSFSIMGLIVTWPYIYKWHISRSSTERQADHAEDIWRREMRDQGHTADEIAVHAEVRLALAAIQEAASQAVYDNDGDIDEQINEIAMIQIMALGDRTPYGRALINVLKQTPGSDLLYPDALIELEHQYKAKERARTGFQSAGRARSLALYWCSSSMRASGYSNSDPGVSFRTLISARP